MYGVLFQAYADKVFFSENLLFVCLFVCLFVFVSNRFIMMGCGQKSSVLAGTNNGTKVSNLPKLF